ncbi:plasmid mobilization protein [Amycolatopsis sp. NPDC088138]|uniref:plasmid mobilization protein n=1 Tax=Amycolatopsis sp. NPDC088138 TaxID=3363938 RepID=UPI00382ADF9E
MSGSEKRKKDQLICIRCTVWEKQLIEKVAAISRVSVAEFVRGAALKRAQDVVDAVADRAANGGDAA